MGLLSIPGRTLSYGVASPIYRLLFIGQLESLLIQERFINMVELNSFAVYQFYVLFVDVDFLDCPGNCIEACLLPYF